MKEYQQKHIFRTITYSKTTIVILFVLIILLLRSIVELYAKSEEVAKLQDDSSRERSQIEEKVQKAEVRNADLNTPRGFESYVRTTYPVVKEGEGVIVIYDDTGSPVVPVREDISLWERTILLWQKITTSKK